MTGVLVDFDKECGAAMFHDNIDHARLMVHALQVEDIYRRKRRREGKKPRPLDQASSRTGRSSYGIQERPNFNNDISNHVILLFIGKVMPKGTGLAPRRAIIEIPA